MKLDDARRVAEDLSSDMVYQSSKKWYHRGIYTNFDSNDYEANDWQPVELPEMLQLHRRLYGHRNSATRDLC